MRVARRPAQMRPENLVKAVSLCTLGSTSRVDLGPEERDLVVESGFVHVYEPRLRAPVGRHSNDSPCASRSP